MSNRIVKIRSSAARVPRRRQRGPRLADGGDLPLTVVPGGQQRQEDVVAVAREVAPPRRPLLVHGHRVPVAPDQVHRDVPQQRRARAVAVRIDALQDLGAGRRLGLEVAPDHGRELVQRLEDREVQISAEVGRKDETAVPVDDERPHRSPALPSCPTVTYVDVRSLLATLIERRAVAHPCSREPHANLETAPRDITERRRWVRALASTDGRRSSSRLQALLNRVVSVSAPAPAVGATESAKLLSEGIGALLGPAAAALAGVRGALIASGGLGVTR